jgi:hypothetical protein
MMNQYYGAWNGPEEGLIPMLDRAGKQFPDKMYIISEFGTPGVFATDATESDQLRSHTLQYQMDVFQKYDWIAGAIFWCYQDYKSHRNLWPGYSAGYVDHGVVDENRQRRPSFFAWEKRTSPAVLAAKWKYGKWYEVGGFEVPLRESLWTSCLLPVERLQIALGSSQSGKQTSPPRRLPARRLGARAGPTAEWQGDPSIHHLSLHLTLSNPRGEVVAEDSLDICIRRPGQEIQDMSLPAVKP